jgi:hypothetical protein
VTKHDKRRTEAARRLENQGHRAAQLPLMAQPMLHHPTATRATAFLPGASAMVPSRMTGRFAVRIEVSHPSSEISEGLGKIGISQWHLVQIPARRAHRPWGLPTLAQVALPRVLLTVKTSAAQLCYCRAGNTAWCGAPAAPLCQQPCGELASTHPPVGAAHTRIQVKHGPTSLTLVGNSAGSWQTISAKESVCAVVRRAGRALPRSARRQCSEIEWGRADRRCARG